MAWRNEQTQPLPDDQASLGSYQSDAYTLPGDPIQDDGCSVYSHDSYDSDCREEELASYRVPREHGVSQPVYEAWVIYYSNNPDATHKTTICGMPVWTHYEEGNPYIACFTQSHEQDELADMNLAAIDRYHAANKRSLPARLVRGRCTKSYEQDLDARIQKLPRAVQSELNGLLGDREAATGNRFHKRDWTVTMMREQYRFRFASAEPEEVKKGSKRFWKKNGGRPSEYFFVLRGADGKVATDNKGMQKATRHGNPWKRVDMTERDLKQRAREASRGGFGFGGKDFNDGDEWQRRARSRSRDRSSSPPPRRVRVESEGPDTYYPNPFTPGPQPGARVRSPLGPLLPPPPPPPGAFGMPSSYGWHVPIPSADPCCYSRFGGLGRYPPPPPPPPMPQGPPPPMPCWTGGPGPFCMGDFGIPSFLPSTPFGGMNSSAHTYPAPPPPPPMPLGSQGTGDDCARDLRSFPSLGVNDPFSDFGNYGDTNFDAQGDGAVSSATTLPFQYTGSSCATSPPPAPRLSNLTTPTTFCSPASSNMTGSSDGQQARVFAGQAGIVNSHALQDYQMQLMLLEQQNKRRLMMARQEKCPFLGASMPAPSVAGVGSQDSHEDDHLVDAEAEEARPGSPDSAYGYQSSVTSVSDTNSLPF